MPLPSSGQIRMGADVNVELGNPATTQISLGATGVRTLYSKASGDIRLAADGYGKSNAPPEFTATISTNQQELNLATYATTAGWNGTAPAIITISAGVYIWSDNTAVAGLTTGSFPGGLTIINNGYIIGKGGAGGAGAGAGSAGGPAISLGVNATITNNAGAYIAGGGGGGANRGGGGAGGGQGGASGGAGGAVGSAGTTGVGAVGTAGVGGGAGGGGGSVQPGPPVTRVGTGGGGGRILPGTGGSKGAGDVPGGNGGSADGAGANSASAGGGGGGWGAAGGTGGGGIGGGAGGKAIALNGYTATRSGAGTTYGAVS